MATDSRTYSVYGTLARATEKAMLIKIHSIEGKDYDDTKPPEWFPKTQIVDSIITDDEDPDAPLDEFTIKHWILSEKGLVPA
jgi:hypothetical protein